MKMRKGAAVGGSVSGIIFLAIIIFVIVKIVMPKLTGAKDEVLVKAYAVELGGRLRIYKETILIKADLECLEV